MYVLGKQEREKLWNAISVPIFNLWKHENVPASNSIPRSVCSGCSPYMFVQQTFNGKVAVLWTLKFRNLINSFQDIATTDKAKDAHSILSAILFNYQNFFGQKTVEELLDYVQRESCAYYIPLNEDGSIKRILRIDIARKIELNKKDNNRPEFTGGLFHVLKHFSFNGKNLTYGNETYDVPDVFHIAYLAGALFAGDLRIKSKSDKKIKYETNYPVSETKMLWAYFSQEVESGVYFLDSLVVKSAKQNFN